MTHNDENIWQRVTQTIKTYMPKKQINDIPQKKPKNTKKTDVIVQESSTTSAPPHSTTPPTPTPVQTELDAATTKRIQRGKLPIDATLDLHGLNQDDAFQTLQRFIHSAKRQKHRTLLIITGKGRQSSGVLRRMLPLWLENSEFHHDILGFSQAQPKDGGTGAFYLRLRNPDKKHK